MPEEVVRPMATLSRLKLDRASGAESKITINGAEELKQEIVRARAVESLAATLGDLDPSDLASFKFSLTISW